jgi:hypothetical protein
MKTIIKAIRPARKAVHPHENRKSFKKWAMPGQLTSTQTKADLELRAEKSFSAGRNAFAVGRSGVPYSNPAAQPPSTQIPYVRGVFQGTNRQRKNCHSRVIGLDRPLTDRQLRKGARLAQRYPAA